jgi:hypothetical protein
MRVRRDAEEACRALAAQGITGRLEMWRPGRPRRDMACDIEKGAGLTVVETDAVCPSFRRWEPFRADAREHPFAVVTGRSRTDVCGFQVDEPTKNKTAVGERMRAACVKHKIHMQRC